MTTEAIQKLVKQFEANREKFEAFCRSLSEEELARPVPDSTWMVKDFVSHLGTLDTMLTRQFESFAAGKAETLGKNEDGTPFNIDSWNDAAVENGAVGRWSRCWKRRRLTGSRSWRRYRS